MKDLLMESYFFYLKEDKNVIINRTVDLIKSKGPSKIKQTFIKNLKLTKEALKKKGVDVPRLQKEAINTANRIKPLAKKLMTESGNRASILKTIMNTINTDANSLIDSFSLDRSTRLFAACFFIQICFMFLAKIIIGGSLFPLLICAIFVSPIIELIFKKLASNESEETKNIFIGLLDKFAGSRFLTLVLISGIISIPFALFILSINMLYEIYNKLLSDEKITDPAAKSKLNDINKKTLIVVFFCILFAVFFKNLTPYLSRLLNWLVTKLP